MKRCKWCNEKNPLYVEYHDKEWGVLRLDDDYLFEMLILESFQAGLSWECILNKRENFRKAFDYFQYEKICDYNDDKVASLLENKGIVRNKRKIVGTIQNAKVWKSIVQEFGSFSSYLLSFTKGEIFYEVGLDRSPLSDTISKDLSHRGMTFVGSKIIYAFLQAVGIIDSHDEECDFYYKKKSIGKNF